MPFRMQGRECNPGKDRLAVAISQEKNGGRMPRKIPAGSNRYGWPDDYGIREHRIETDPALPCSTDINVFDSFSKIVVAERTGLGVNLACYPIKLLV
jgi:hypothetical protein